MEKEPEPVVQDNSFYDKSRLIILPSGDYVAIHHRHLDHLIGSLMAIFDLNGDKVQRDALKSEVKMRCRQWLNDQYYAVGYEEYEKEQGIDQKQPK